MVYCMLLHCKYIYTHTNNNTSTNNHTHTHTHTPTHKHILTACRMALKQLNYIAINTMIQTYTLNCEQRGHALCINNKMKP